MTTADTRPDQTQEAFAPAKINLALHVTGQRADGYHLLDSLVVFANVGDRLWVSPARALSLSLAGRFVAGVPRDGRNLVWKAAVLAGVTATIRLEKNLPNGAGLGGGSADAAALLRAVESPVDALSLGADVPVCLSAIPQIMRGIGDLLAPAAPVPELHVVLVNPMIPLDTAAVFGRLRSKTNPAMTPMPTKPGLNGFLNWLGAQRNDLQAPALEAAPILADVLAALEGSLLARMSGSGATCFGIYRDRHDARAAARALRAAHPDWWVQRAMTGGAGVDQDRRATT